MTGPRLVIATRNQGKLAEFRRLLADLRVPVISLDDAGVTITVEETGRTYAANATLKAVGYARAAGEVTLADDSGIEVDALGGAPGVDSAVFTGPGQTDEQRTAKVLELTANVPASRRTARYRAIVAVAKPDGDCRLFEGACPGRLAAAPQGDRGFGYDPIFVPDGGTRTMAELSAREKDAISHRGNALREALPYLRSLLGDAGGRRPATR